MFPGGTLEDNDSNLNESLKREVLEETNIKIEIIKLIHTELITSKTPPNLGLVYLCNSKSTNIVLSEEHDNFIWANLEEINVDDVSHPALIELTKPVLI